MKLVPLRIMISRAISAPVTMIISSAVPNLSTKVGLKKTPRTKKKHDKYKHIKQWVNRPEDHQDKIDLIRNRQWHEKKRSGRSGTTYPYFDLHFKNCWQMSLVVIYGSEPKKGTRGGEGHCVWWRRRPRRVRRLEWKLRGMINIKKAKINFDKSSRSSLLVLFGKLMKVSMRWAFFLINRTSDFSLAHTERIYRSSCRFLVRIFSGGRGASSTCSRRMRSRYQKSTTNSLTHS